MNDEVVLPQKYALILLRKLADDDSFRDRYEADTLLALRSIGVPEEILERIAPANLKPMKLADRSVFLEGLMMLIDEKAIIVMCLIVPQIQVFSPVKGNVVKSSVSFEAPQAANALATFTARQTAIVETF